MKYINLNNKEKLYVTQFPYTLKITNITIGIVMIENVYEYNKISAVSLEF